MDYDRDSPMAPYLQAALDAVPLGVVVKDETGRVVFRNRRAAALGDPRTADVLLADAVDDLMAAASRGEPQARTIELRGPPPRVLEVSVEPLAADRTSPGRPGSGRDGAGVSVGSAFGAVAVIADVSDRRQLDAVRRDFVANVSHELRTPVGALGLLAETLSGEDDPEVTGRLADRICFEAERVGHIIDDLLDLSRIEVEGLARQANVPVAGVVAAAADRVSALAARREVPIFLPEVDASLAVRGDESQLVGALTNLLDNAIRYSEAGSPVTVSVSTDNGRGMIELTVSDRGIGIPGRDHERIFERFYRVDQARSRRTGGTGLGLAIVRHVITNHGGEVALESREGEGSAFTLRLPGGSWAGGGSPPETMPG